MLLTLKKTVGEENINHVLEKIKEFGFEAHISRGTTEILIGVIGENVLTKKDIFESMNFVEKVTPISKPYKLISKDFHPVKKVIALSYGVNIGGEKIEVMAGPCSIDTLDNLYDTANSVKNSGASILRGGAFKPRTSPYAFQGLGEEGLKMLKEVGDALKMPIITEAMTIHQVHLVAKYADIIQIGARNSQNFDLLREAGKSKKPVFLKRGMAMSVSEFLMSAEYIASEGNYNIMLCERGIRTFETSTRFTMDLNIIPVLNSLTNLPIVLDPSHGTGVRDYIKPMARASVAAGADSLMIEVHPKPEEALSDGPQALLFDQFDDLMNDVKKVALAVGRKA